MDYEKAYKEALERAKQIEDNPYTAHWDVMKETVEYVFPELRESENERIRKDIVEAVELHKDFTQGRKEHIYAWLKKQGEHANFRNKIQIGDKVTRNEDGVLVNLSQLNRVAKKDEKQGEQPKKHDVCDNCDQQDSCVSPCPMKLVEKHSEQKSWSEEDETNFRRTEYAVMKFFGGDCSLVSWLRKSLKDRFTWKPSDEQMNALDDVISSRYIKYDVLSELWKDLKKLREE